MDSYELMLLSLATQEFLHMASEDVTITVRLIHSFEHRTRLCSISWSSFGPNCEGFYSISKARYEMSQPLGFISVLKRVVEY